MTTNREAVCSSCRQPKFRLTPKKSRLKPEMMLLLCETCIKNRFEPRGIVMLVGREYGPEAIKDYIRPKRYLGEPILVEDLY